MEPSWRRCKRFELEVIQMAASTEIRDRNRKVLSRGVVTCAAVAWAVVLIAYGDDQDSPPPNPLPPQTVSMETTAYV